MLGYCTRCVSRHVCLMITMIIVVVSGLSMSSSNNKNNIIKPLLKQTDITTKKTVSPSASFGATRRHVISSACSTAALFGIATTTTCSPVNAVAVTDETPRITTRMGGLLEKYQDGPRGWSILAPSGWNKFEGEAGAYDVKWQDLVDPKDNIKVSSTPVKSTTTSIDILGDVQELGANLASKRDAKLVSALERQTDGILFYQFDFALNDNTHQLLLLCVNKGKIWSLDANTVEKRWSKRKELYYNVVGSFMPKLN